MSYPNFSYYNGPSTPTSCWTPPGNAAVECTSRSVTQGYSGLSRLAPNVSVYCNPALSQSEAAVPRHQVLQGKVTQLFSNFGYVNDDIIFSICDVMGPMVKVGDKVAVDATFQPNNPTKYKGERVYKIDESRFNSTGSTNSSKMKTLTQIPSNRIDLTSNSRSIDKYNAIEIPIKERSNNKFNNNESNFRKEVSVITRLGNKSEFNNQLDVLSKNKRSEEFKNITNFDIKCNTSDRSQLNNINVVNSPALKRVAHNEEVDSHKTISTSKNRKLSTEIKNNKPTVVSPVKYKSESKSKYVLKGYENFSSQELDYALVNLQCRTLKVPNEFFHASLKYQQSFPLNHPIKLGNNCHFKIMDKKVKSNDSFVESQLSSDIDPYDTDTTFVAKVMLLSTDDLAKLYKDTLITAEEFDSNNKIPITKAIKFLVGSMGENKEFGIGGAWSPSLDGHNPESNPRVLINTAIRTCKSITGIDLSSCSSWPKFLELHYYRPPQKLCSMKKNNEVIIDLDETTGDIKSKEPRMETVVYFIPDVWNCTPSQDDWNEMKRLYQEQLTCVTRTPSMSTVSSIKDVMNSTKGTEPSNQGIQTFDDIQEENFQFNETEGIDDKSKKSENESTLKEQPTHFSKLTISLMKIIEIKKELELRQLNSRGVMEQLKARLKSAIEKEENDEKNKGDSTPLKVVLIKKTSENILTENEKVELKKLYIIPDRPEIIVHQNRKLFNNQMKIRTMSLHSLLSYYDVTLQESTFELAFFAKQFLEMLRRDAIFNIYKSIVVVQDEDLIDFIDSKKGTKLKENSSKRTVNKQLLFSCALLDREKTNKISIDDLKVLIEGLGIFLSSKQLCDVLDKIKDSSNFFNYRQLTDKEITDMDILNLVKVDVIDDFDYIKELALGNKALFEMETINMNTDFNNTEVEKLRNELDKSERCRQSVELKACEMKEETEKNINIGLSQIKEIQMLKDQVSEYKTKCQSEQSRGDQYKRDLEKLLRRLKDIDKLAACLNKSVSDSLDRNTDNSEKLQNGNNIVSKSKNIKPVMFDLTDECLKTDHISNDIEMTERSEDMVGDTTTLSQEEDFDLSKPSDYDMLILDDTD